MATGTSILGTRLLDVLASNTSLTEVATFGNMSSNTLLRIYDSNLPQSTGYLMGLCNNAFMVMHGNPQSNTNVGIGTTRPLSTAQLHVQGTIATSNIISYTPTNTLTFSNATLAGISNITTSNLVVNGTSFGRGQWDGAAGAGSIYTTSNVGIGTSVPQGRLDVRGGIAYFASNVGIGTTTPTSNLTVQGDALVSGTLTVTKLLDLSGSSGSFNSWPMYNAVNGSKTCLTNDTTASNRVLFEFTLLAGQFLVNVNIPFRNLSSLISIDTTNWATIGLYSTTAASFNDSLTPICAQPLLAIGGTGTDFDTCSLTTFIGPILSTTYVIAVTGKGHQIQFGGTGMPTPTVYTSPLRGLGTDDKIDLRQAFQLNPIRGTFTSTEGQQSFFITSPGIYDVQASNVDVYINGAKYMWRTPGNNSDFTLTTSVSGVNTTYGITLTNPLSQGNEVEVAIWPAAVGTNFYSSGYLYQTVNNYSTRWMNVVGGGIRTSDRLIIDNDVFIRGNVYFGCNTTGFLSGAQWEGDSTSITSNIIGTDNIIDGAITNSKLNDGAVTVSKIANGTITTTKLASDAITAAVVADNSIPPSKLDLLTSNLGIRTATARTALDVNGTVMTTAGYALNTVTPALSYDFVESSSSASVPVTAFQTSNAVLTVSSAKVKLQAVRNITVSNGFVQTWSGWTATGLIAYNATGGFMNSIGIDFDQAPATLTNTTTTTYACDTGGGWSIIALVRFNTSIPNSGDVIFSTSTAGASTYFTLRRSATNSSALQLDLFTNGVLQQFVASEVISFNEWAVFAVTVSSVSNGVVNIYKNGRIVSSGTNTQQLSSYAFTSAYVKAPNQSGGFSLGGLMVFDAALSADQFQTVNSYFMQARVCSASPQSVLSTNPVTYTNAGDVATTGAAQNMDVNANLRVHALPSDPVWAYDAYTSIRTFTNESTNTLPYFDRANGVVSFNPNYYLQFPPSFFRIGSHGLTFVMKVRFMVLAAANTSDSFLYLGNDADPSTSTNPYIHLTYVPNDTSRLRLAIRNNSGQVVNVDQDGIGKAVYTIVVRIDPSAKGSITFWVNGVQGTTNTSVFGGSFAPLQNQYFPIVAMNRTNMSTGMYAVYAAALYNRALSDSEVAQVHSTLSTDMPANPVELGSRNGRNALSVSKEGYVSPVVLSPDNISNLFMYIPFDSHTFDATAGINWLGTPQVVGNIQFNPRGRIGQSLILTNNESLTTTTNYLVYPLNYTLSNFNGITFAIWIKYFTINNTMTVFNVVDSSLTNPSVMVCRITTANTVQIQVQISGTLSSVMTSATTLIPSAWNHVSFVLPPFGSTADIYVNGTGSTVSVGTSLNIIPFQRFLFVGSSNATAGFNGELDDFRVYNRLLSADEVSQLANMGANATGIQFNSGGTGNPLVNINTGAVQITAPLQLSPTTTVDSVITDSTTMASTINVSAQGYQLLDLTGVQRDLVLSSGMSLSTAGPFANVPTEGSIVFPGSRSMALSDSRYQFNWWQNGGFTLEMWVNYTNFTGASYTWSTGTIPGLIGNLNASTNTPSWAFGATSTGALTFYYFRNGTATTNVTTTTTLTAGTWQHIAVSFDITSIRLFIDGVLRQTAALVATAATPTANMSLGQIAPGGIGVASVNASVSSVRLVSGVALYTASFTPSTVPLSISNSGTTQMLLRNSLNLQTPMTLTNTGNMTLGGNICAGNLGMFRNRIINGDMQLDQRNSSTANTMGGVANTGVTISEFAADRFRLRLGTGSGTWSLQRISNDAPPGFMHAIRATVTTALASLGTNTSCSFEQIIEGINIIDFKWGTQYAMPICVSFWVKSSIAGLYSMRLDNGSTGVRGYLSPFTINSANTWERKTFVVPGDTLGTWNTTEASVGLRLSVCFANNTTVSTTLNTWYGVANEMRIANMVQLVSTVGSTFAMTGVQIEKGTVVTPFEFRPFTIEQLLCYRYCRRWLFSASDRIGICGTIGTGEAITVIYVSPSFMVSPSTVTFSSGAGGFGLMLTSSSAVNPSGIGIAPSSRDTLAIQVLAGVTQGNAYILKIDSAGWMQVDVEL